MSMKVFDVKYECPPVLESPTTAEQMNKTPPLWEFGDFDGMEPADVLALAEAAHAGLSWFGSARVVSNSPTIDTGLMCDRHTGDLWDRLPFTVPAAFLGTSQGDWLRITRRFAPVDDRCNEVLLIEPQVHDVINVAKARGSDVTIAPLVRDLMHASESEWFGGCKPLAVFDDGHTPHVLFREADIVRSADINPRRWSVRRRAYSFYQVNRRAGERGLDPWPLLPVCVLTSVPSPTDPAGIVSA